MFDHEMGIERQFRAAAQGFDDRYAEGQVRYEMAVHQVEMDAVGPLPFNVLDFFGQAGKISRQYRGVWLQGFQCEKSNIKELPN